MLDLLKFYFNLPMFEIFSFGFKFLFLLMLLHIATRTTRIVYRVHIRRPIKRWLNCHPKNSGSLKIRKKV